MSRLGKNVGTKVAIKRLKGEEIDSIPYPSELLDVLKETKTLESTEENINALIRMESDEAKDLASTYRGV